MSNKQSLPRLVVKRTRAIGRGVFAGEFIKKGSRIEVCHVIPFSKRHKPLFVKTPLDNYCYLWGTGYCIATGFGSLYNHSEQPNAKFTANVARNVIIFTASQDIPAGQQILIDYGWNPRQ